jgi:DNA-binding response OmpR family regulator
MTTKILLFYDKQEPKHIIDILNMHDYKVTLSQNFDENIIKDKDLLLFYEVEHIPFIETIKHRSQLDHIPMIVLSKNIQASYQIESLKAGADDFIYSLENIQVIMARLERLLVRYRMVQKKTFGRIKFKHLILDLNHYEVKVQGKPASITHKEFELLRLFFSNPEKTLTKDDMYKVIWKHTEMYSENVINVHIRHLRKKIELDPSNPEVIMTIWGFGYKLGEGQIEHIT